MNDLFSGWGTYTWPANSGTYTGYWVDGKMHWNGEYKNSEGVVLNGQFRNNCFDMNGQYKLNPLNSGSINDKYMINCDKHRVTQEKLAKDTEERVRFFRVNSCAELGQAL